MQCTLRRDRGKQRQKMLRAGAAPRRAKKNVGHAKMACRPHAPTHNVDLTLPVQHILCDVSPVPFCAKFEVHHMHM